VGVFVVSQKQNELAKRERERERERARYSCVIRRYDICYDMSHHHPSSSSKRGLKLLSAWKP
jgi:hypothetical protein